MNPRNKKCERSCNVNGIIQNNGSCKCLDGYKNVNNFCQNCTALGQTIDFTNLSCKCLLPQYYQAANGTCVNSPCKGQLLYSIFTQKCYCPDDLI